MGGRGGRGGGRGMPEGPPDTVIGVFFRLFLTSVVPSVPGHSVSFIIRRLRVILTEYSHRLH
jgi:hypothetical protein